MGNRSAVVLTPFADLRQAPIEDPNGRPCAADGARASPAEPPARWTAVCGLGIPLGPSGRGALAWAESHELEPARALRWDVGDTSPGATPSRPGLATGPPRPTAALARRVAV